MTVLVKGDTLDERTETFFVNLSNPVNASLAKAEGVGRIRDDDTAPTLALSPSQPSFRRGETLSLTATVTPGATPTAVDAYVALPGGTLFFLQGDGSLTTDLRPIVTNWTVAPFSGEIFRYTFSGGEPPGSYTWYAAFTVPGGNPLFGTIGPIVSAPFSFSP